MIRLVGSKKRLSLATLVYYTDSGGDLRLDTELAAWGDKDFSELLAAL